MLFFHRAGWGCNQEECSSSFPLQSQAPRTYIHGMKSVYLDMCCLKRPFDDQAQARIGVESEAVERILAAGWIGLFRLLNSPALMYENFMNPNALRRMRVFHLLRDFTTMPCAAEKIRHLSDVLSSAGIDDLDALHLAYAEAMKADVFVTCDDDLLSKTSRLKLKTQIKDPISFVKEEMT